MISLSEEVEKTYENCRYYPYIESKNSVLCARPKILVTFHVHKRGVVSGLSKSVGRDVLIILLPEVGKQGVEGV